MGPGTPCVQEREPLISIYKIILSLAVGCLLAACGNEQAASEQESQRKQESDAAVTSEFRVLSVPTIAGEVEAEAKAAGGEISLGPGLQRLVDLAKQDLGARLGLEQAEIEIVQAEYVTWRDSSVGCPQPGYQYTQVLTNGSLIRLGANKQVYHYHSGRNRPPTLCENPSATEPLPYAPGES